MSDLTLISERYKGHKGFYLETHLHTNAASACASISPEDTARMYKKAGYDGIVVTDHFMSGNTSVDKTLPWEEQIDMFFEGYRRAKEEGDKIGLLVFEGLEYTDYGTDFLVYGLSREFLKANPQMMQMEPPEFLKLFREGGATLIQAHPYREASYVREVRPYPQFVDAIEVRNMGNSDPEFDRKALKLAKMMNLPMTAGSDCHTFGDENFGVGIILEKEPKDLAEICKLIREGKIERFGG